jgi:hypothetical protein
VLKKAFGKDPDFRKEISCVLLVSGKAWLLGIDKMAGVEKVQVESSEDRGMMSSSETDTVLNLERGFISKLC